MFYAGGQNKAAADGRADYYDWGKHTSVFGYLGWTSAKLNKSAVIGCYVYGADHTSGVVARAFNGLQAERTFLTDTIICGTGGHSAGFISCQSEAGGSNIKNCFTNVDMYATKESGGFSYLTIGNFENCFSTGKLEGYESLAGFTAGPNPKYSADNPVNYKNCYSTVLVGMRSESNIIGGFARGVEGTAIYDSCYAAGEVGDYNTVTDMQAESTIAGGFSYDTSGCTFNNCYYDKQTTAMRGWVTSRVNEQVSDGVSGIKGLLTTDTDKSGAGLAGEPGDAGFTGFTDDSAWHYEEGLYPQIASIRNSSASDWGSQECADIAKANSLVSVSTVYLDTWDEGYDWNSKGVRSKGEVSYNRTAEEAISQAQKEGDDTSYLGNINTYDTVREIVSDFTVTDGAGFDYAIPSGSITEKDNWKDDQIERTRGAITISSGTGTVINPGVELFSISRTSQATRPIRLVSFMEVEAGRDKEVAVDETYDHRQDMELTIMDSLTDNLVIGFHNNEVWGTAATQGHPGYQAKYGDDDFGVLIGKDGNAETELTKHYYEVPTAETDFASSRNAIIYTEIWFTGYKGQDPLDEPISVKVTGEGTNMPVLSDTEQQWIGALPIGSGMAEGMQFEISYYWMLFDGRYRTDSKTITLTPGKYDLTEKVYNEDGSQNSTALRLKAAEYGGVGDVSVGQQTSHLAELKDNAGGSDMLAAWEIADKDETSVISVMIKYSLADELVSSKEAILYMPQPGDKMTVSVPYYGYKTETETDAPGGGKYERLVMEYEPVYVDLTLEVREEQAGDSVIRYIVFDKGASYNKDDGWISKDNGIEAGEIPFDILQIDEIEFDIDVVLTVASHYDFSLFKTDGATDDPLAGVSFSLYEAAAGDKLTLEEVKALGLADVTVGGAEQTAEGSQTNQSGNLIFEDLTVGKWYYLVETQPLPGNADFNGMIRIYRDTDGRITMQPLSAEGEPVGSAAVYEPGGGASDDGTLELPLDKWQDKDGVYIQTSVKNYQSVDMPVSTGGGAEGFLMTGGILLLAGIFSLIASVYRREKS